MQQGRGGLVGAACGGTRDLRPLHRTYRMFLREARCFVFFIQISLRRSPVSDAARGERLAVEINKRKVRPAQPWPTYGRPARVEGRGARALSPFMGSVE